MELQQQTDRKDALLVDADHHEFTPRLQAPSVETTSNIKDESLSWRIWRKSTTQIVVLMAMVALLVVLLPVLLSLFIEDTFIVKALVIGFVVFMVLLISVIVRARQLL